jgi:pyruvate dehydrogenase E2 component (dihydrolipoamide acetyltransferase)
MAEKVLMLALSPTMEVGTITKWNKQEGDQVKSGDVLCEVETDKAVMDYEATQEGTLLKIVTPQAGKARVGEMIAVVGQPGEDLQALLAQKQTSQPLAASEQPQTVKRGETPREKPVAEETAATTSEHERLKVSPLARKIAQDAGVDLQHVSGSGPGGRIVKQDVEQALSAGGTNTGPQAPQAAAGQGDETIAVSAKRKIIAARMTASKQAAPHYYLKIAVDMDGILAARRTLNEERPAKVSLNTFLIKFAAEALKRHPLINATWNGATITKHRNIDIGLAVAQPDGLITPIVKDCGHKGILAIENDLKALIPKAQNNRLTPAEYTGATFTISNLGSFGILEFTAIINPPASAILAVGEIRKVPVVDANEQVRIRSKIILTLSCDHRVIDGATGAAFLKEYKAMLENPIRVLY